MKVSTNTTQIVIKPTETTQAVVKSTTDTHSHTNKQILDNITQTIIDNSHNHPNKQILDNVSQTIIDNSHTHNNKTVLDNLTQNVINNSHTHTNKTYLDNYNPSNFASASHNHDDRYYTETEINNLLNGKANINHNHTLSGLSEKSYNSLTDKPDLSSLHTHANKTDLDNYNPANFASASHNHDNRYYTETEIDTLLSNKQDTLVSGTNIKTINGQSILGSGDIQVATQSSQQTINIIHWREAIPEGWEFVSWTGQTQPEVVNIGSDYPPFCNNNIKGFLHFPEGINTYYGIRKFIKVNEGSIVSEENEEFISGEENLWQDFILTKYTYNWWGIPFIFPAVDENYLYILRKKEVIDTSTWTSIEDPVIVLTKIDLTLEYGQNVIENYSLGSPQNFNDNVSILLKIDRKLLLLNNRGLYFGYIELDNNMNFVQNTTINDERWNCVLAYDSSYIYILWTEDWESSSYIEKININTFERELIGTIPYVVSDRLLLKLDQYGGFPIIGTYNYRKSFSTFQHLYINPNTLEVIELPQVLSGCYGESQCCYDNNILYFVDRTDDFYNPYFKYFNYNKLYKIIKKNNT